MRSGRGRRTGSRRSPAPLSRLSGGRRLFLVNPSTAAGPHALELDGAARTLARAQRVVVIGSPGAGKSTLSVALAARLGLPLVHLDRLYHLPGWREPSRHAWRAIHADIVARERWLIDGHFESTLAERLGRADAAVHLDLGRLVCLARVLRRVARTHGRTRPDMADGCPERFDPAFLRFVWHHPETGRPRTLERLAAFAAAGGQVVTLRAPAGARALVAALDAGERTATPDARA